ncbi:MAG: hypothetical protein IJT03_00650, partial [Clostridia bacterium]|nr:hypothetical protein [Clostridia bacterium]
APGDSHGGGDLALTEDFVRYISGDTPSISCTPLSDSVKGHLTVFKADESMEHGGIPEKISL